MTTKGYLGIDAGTQGLSAIFTDGELNVLATGEGHYEMVSGLETGCYEQRTDDWDNALKTAMSQLRERLRAAHSQFEVLGVGVSGQMHGEVLVGADGRPLCPVRLWCDSRNEQEGSELTEKLGVKMPKRITAARWLWTLRNRADVSRHVAHITTPAGWISYRLSGEWCLGIGDAAGMFPIDQATLDFDESRLKLFDAVAGDGGVRPLRELLPAVRRAGENGGTLNDAGAQLLGLPEGTPIAPAEGDQPAALAGSLIGDAGMVSVSFGTSVCANSVGDRAFEGVSEAVDHFCAADGKPINMVWLRNGTTFMNSVVEMFGKALGGDRGTGFSTVMPQLLSAPPDAGGLMALPFMDDEPGLGVAKGGAASIIGLNEGNATPGNAAKAALLSTMFNLRLGSEVLDRQGFPRTRMVLSGGLTKTPELGQILADVFRTPVSLLDSAEEGTAWGAALMAKYRHEALNGNKNEWSQFLNQQSTGPKREFTPDDVAADAYDRVYRRYQKLIDSREFFGSALD